MRKRSLEADPKLNNILDRMDACDPKPETRDRRSVRRFSFRQDVEVSVEHPGGTTSQVAVITRNISAGGLSFLAERFLYPGSRCVVSLAGRNGEHKAPGRIASCRHIQGAVHEVGVRFDRRIDTHALRRGAAAIVDDGKAVAPADLRGRLLYVDDSSVERLLMQQRLRLTGVQLAMAESLAQAVAAYEAEPIDIMLCDLYLDSSSGLEVVEAIRHRGFEGPVVMVTAETGSPQLKPLRDAGVCHILTKPYKSEELLEVVTSLHRQAGAIVRADDLHSTMEEDPLMRTSLPAFIEHARKMAERMRTSAAAKNLTQLREACLSMKGSAGGYGYGGLAEAAANAVKSLDATQSIAESRAPLRALELLCMNIGVRGATPAAKAS